MALHEGLHHDHLLHIEEAFKSGRGELCLRMGLAAGQELFDRAGTLSCRESLLVAREVGDALRYLHRRGFVHRDCKPENVMIQPNGSCVLIDLGSMRPWGSVAAVEGTLAYMAPEARGKKKQKVLPSLDAWSLGATISVAILGIAIRNSQEAVRSAHRRHAQVGIIHAAARLMKESIVQRDTIASFLFNLHEPF
jgi:serine/threonine protein kinase